MADTAFEHEQLAAMLEVSRDFALEQIGQGKPLLPFATRGKLDGEIEFVRFVDDETEMPLEEIYSRTQAELASQAKAGEIYAAAMVAAVQFNRSRGERTFRQAIQVHIEAPDYSRIVLVPFRVDPIEGEKDSGELVTGDLVPMDAPAVIYAN